MRSAVKPRLTQSESPAIVWPLIEAVQDGGNVREVTREQVRGLGFEWFALLLANRAPSGMGGGQEVLNGAPDGLLATYRERNFHRIDPRQTTAARTGLPQIWDQTSLASDPLTSDMYEIMASFGCGHGVHIALHQPEAPFVAFFIVASPERVLTNAHRQSISRQLPSLWALGAYGRKLLPYRFRAPRDLRNLLSTRELQCLAHVAQGFTSREIGAELDISERTVNAHVERCIRKCGARNRQEAIAHAIERGLLKV